MLLALFAAAAPALVVTAPVTSVTVFNDRARVVRSARVELSGARLFELALLPDSVDPGSIRLEAKGAEVRQVDLQHVDQDDFPAGPARALLEKLEKQDDAIAAAARERRDHAIQLGLLRRLQPAVPEGDPLKAPPRLNPSGWAQAFGFLEGGTEREQARLRELDQKLIDQRLEREKLAAEAQRIGATRRLSGLRVTALLAGEGTAQVALTYTVGGARWTPAYDVTYLPGQEKVQVTFSGLVTQQSGEEWDEAALTLSTAVPGVATQLPKLLTWKIGEKERFVPQSRAARPPAPPPPAPQAPMLQKGPQLPDARAEAEELRAALVTRAQSPPGEPAATESEGEDDAEAAAELDGAAVAGKRAGGGGASFGRAAGVPHGVAGAISGGVMGGIASGATANRPQQAFAKSAPPPPPPAPSMAPAPRPASPPRKAASADLGLDLAPAAAMEAQTRSMAIEVARGRPEPVSNVGLAPPPTYQPPHFGPDAPATLAGGYDLAFTSPRPATVPSGGVARRVPLLAETWSATTERVVFPAVAPEAYLIAKLSNPSARALPGGAADLFVGDDPAGTARLKLMAPGEPLELPLGLDRAIKPVRNVTQVQAEKGVFSKDEVTEYTVTIEVSNPYPQAIPLRIVDQLPLGGDKNAELKLLRTAPEAAPDKDTGQLEWRVQVPASGKSTVTFAYELRRPKGFKVRQ